MDTKRFFKFLGLFGLAVAGVMATFSLDLFVSNYLSKRLTSSNYISVQASALPVATSPSR